MKKYVLPLLGLVGAVVVAVTTIGAGTLPAPRYSLAVDFGALADHPGAYQCQAEIKDLSTGDVLAAPKLAFPAGSPAKAESDIPGRAEKATLSASVDEEHQTLTYEVEVRGAGGVLSRHMATVSLE